MTKWIHTCDIYRLPWWGFGYYAQYVCSSPNFTNQRRLAEWAHETLVETGADMSVHNRVRAGAEYRAWRETHNPYTFRPGQ